MLDLFAPAHTQRPAQIVKTNLFIYAVAQVWMSATLLWCIVHNHPRLMIFFWASVALPPTFIWITYRQCRTAWRGLPPDDANDASWPIVIVTAITIGLAVLVSYLR